MAKYNELKLGQKAEIRHIITPKDIDDFVELTGDDNKLHLDHEYASRTSFKKPVVHGMLGASFISTIIGTKLPGDGALWFSQNLEFILPIRVGDEIVVKAEIIKKIDISETIELKTEVFNQHGQKVIGGTAKVKVIEEKEQEDSLKENKDADSERGNVALVIGATGGIGSAVCTGLAEDGFSVGVHYHRNEEKAKKIKEKIEGLGRKAVVVQGDIGNEDEVGFIVEKTTRRLGPVSVLVNCATSKLYNVKFASLEWEVVQKELDVNLKGVFNVIKAVYPYMEKERFGKIINITTQAIETPNPDWLPYITAKAALNGFTKSLAAELAVKGIRMNMVSPGMINTELIADIPEKARLITASKTPLRRLGEPEDVAGAIRFLASEKADFLAGETIRINGGQVML